MIKIPELKTRRNMSASLVILILVMLPVIVEARFNRYQGPSEPSVKYNPTDLYNAVNKVCCQQGSKREIKSVTGKETASNFLQSRALKSKCCVNSGTGCSVNDVTATSLNEECINEGCRNEEISEVC